MNTWDFLQKLFVEFGEDFWLANKFKINDTYQFTKWYKYSEWKNIYPMTPNYRSILKNELVFESDYATPEENLDLAKKIIMKLKQQKVRFWCIFTGNKSYHIHTFVNELKQLEEYKLEEAKKLVANKMIGEELLAKLDHSNFRNKRLIQIEVSVNPKTQKNTSVFEEFDGEDFCFDFGNSLVIKKKSKYRLENKDWERLLIPKECPALEYALKNKLPSGQMTRYEYVSPSLASYIRFRSNRDELAKNYYEVQKKVGDLEAWDRKPSNFNCKQVRIFFEKNNLGYICEECLTK